MPCITTPVHRENLGGRIDFWGTWGYGYGYVVLYQLFGHVLHVLSSMLLRRRVW
jgi:hypothetical protein